MLSPRIYTACNQADLQTYYNREDNPLLCRICRQKNKTAKLQSYLLPDGVTHWYVCDNAEDCRVACTGTEYLAKVTGTPFVKHVPYLAQQGFLPPITAEDVQKLQKFRQRRAWIQRQFADTAAFRRETSFVFAELDNLDFYPFTNSFRQGTKQTFESLFRPSLSGRKHNTSSTRLFRGKWSKITAIPLYDLPYHLSGFLFVNGHEQGEQTHILKRIGPYAGEQYLFDPGFLGNREVCPPNAESVILCPDWKLALSLQAALYRQTHEYPPLLGWFPVDPRTGGSYTYYWSGLKNNTLIFWSTPNDLSNLREACLQEAMISFAHFNSAGNFATPDKLYRALLPTIVKKADPWHKALTWYLEGGDLQDRLKKLNLPPSIMEKYIEHAPAALRNALTEKTVSLESEHARYIDGSKVLSNEKGWWKLGTGLNRSLLSNTRCVIEKVIHIVDDMPVYQGKILIGKETYPFTEKEDVFEKYTIPTVKKVCVDHGCTHFLRINVKNDAYLRLVKETSAPETIYQKEGYGWSKKEASLLLPNVIISDTTVADTHLSLQTGPFHKMTAAHVKPLGAAGQTALANFQEETPIIFSIFAAVIPPLFAAAYRMRPPQTVIAGGDFMLVKQISDMLGMPQLQTRNKEEIDKFLLTHRCPFLMRFSSTAKKKRITHEWADVLGLHTPAFVWTSAVEALARMSYGQVNLLLLPSTRFYRWFDDKLPRVFQECFMACLQHISRFVLDPEVHTEDWNNDLIKETYRFFDTEIGAAPAKNALFSGYYAQADYFYDYVNLLYRAELLTLNENKIILSELAECYRQHVGIFDFPQIHTALKAGDAAGEYDVKQQTLLLHAEKLIKSRRRLEKFYGALLRS